MFSFITPFLSWMRKSGGLSWTGIYTPSAHYRQYWRLDRPRSLRPGINLPVEPTIHLSVSLSGTHFGTGCRTGDPFSWIGEDEDTRRPIDMGVFLIWYGKFVTPSFFQAPAPFQDRSGCCLLLDGRLVHVHHCWALVRLILVANECASGALSVRCERSAIVSHRRPFAPFTSSVFVDSAMLSLHQLLHLWLSRNAGAISLGSSPLLQAGCSLLVHFGHVTFFPGAACVSCMLSIDWNCSKSQESDAGFEFLCSLLFHFSSELCFVYYLRLSSIRLSSNSLLYFQKYVKNKTKKKKKSNSTFFGSSKLVSALVIRIDSSKKFGFELVDNMCYIPGTEHENGLSGIMPPGHRKR